MNLRVLITGTSVVVCVAALAGVLVRGRQLDSLRAQQRNSLTRPEPARPASTQPATSGGADQPVELFSAASPSLELLRLRHEVTRLTERKRELAGVESENNQLKDRLAASRTNHGSLPPDYIRASQAQLVGYNTPEQTLQSLLWAVRNRDITNFLQAFTPERAQWLRADFEKSGASAEAFFEAVNALPGARIVKQEKEPEDRLSLRIEFIPGEALDWSIRLRRIDGQWKIEWLP